MTKYFVCMTCLHSTLDHEMYGAKPCLIEQCVCVCMVDGDPFYKKKYENPSGFVLKWPKK